MCIYYVYIYIYTAFVSSWRFQTFLPVLASYDTLPENTPQHATSHIEQAARVAADRVSRVLYMALSGVYTALLSVYRALFSVLVYIMAACVAADQVIRPLDVALLSVCGALLSVCGGRSSVYRALLSVYGAREHRALWNVYRALLSEYVCIVPACVATNQVSRALLGAHMQCVHGSFQCMCHDFFMRAMTFLYDLLHIP